MTITLEVTYPNTTEQQLKDNDCFHPDNADKIYGPAHDPCRRDDDPCVRERDFCVVKNEMERYVRKYGFGKLGSSEGLDRVGSTMTLTHIDGVDLVGAEGNELA